MALFGSRIGTPLSTSPEGRKYHRHPLSASGQLIATKPAEGSSFVMACRLIDISRGGAALLVDSTGMLPKHTILKISDFPQKIACEEVYRTETRLGVMFKQELDPAFLKELLLFEQIRPIF